MLPQWMKKVIAGNPKKVPDLIDLVNLPLTLREFMGQSQTSRLGCFKRVWSYIKENKLQPAAMFKVLKESPAIPENLSAEGKDFLHLCFRRNPAERPSAFMLLEHHFVRSPHPPDVLSQSLGGMKLTNENDNTQQERSSYKLDQVPTSLGVQPLKMGLLNKSVCENFTQVRLFGDVSMRL